MERSKAGKYTFKLVTVTVKAEQKLEIRKIFHELGVDAQPKEEVIKAAVFMERLSNLIQASGGEEPKPEKMEFLPLKDISEKSGNEQLLSIYNSRKEISEIIKKAKELNTKIDIKFPDWIKLVNLSKCLPGLSEEKELIQEVSAIEKGRLLVAEPDLILPLQKR